MAALPSPSSAVAPDSIAGLTTVEAHARQAREGANTVLDAKPHRLQQALGKLWGPMPWMLEAAIVLQLVLGDVIQAGFVALLLLFNAGLAVMQESRAQATLDALKLRLAIVASILRDGHWTTLAAAELVVGDVVKLSLGTVVAADVKLISGSILLDQSMLTGESIPVEAGAGVQAYAGALIRRGEALAIVTATGERTKFGRSAELVRTASAESSQQQAVFHVVRNLALFNGAVTLLLVIYSSAIGLPWIEIVPLVLVAVLSSIPVALPSMFTLAAAVGARALAREGVLPTRLSAVEEAAGIDVLCADKTGTLTRNELAVTSVHVLDETDAPHVLALAALASSDGGQDPVDASIRAASAAQPIGDGATLIAFTPFDPALKRSQASARLADGSTVQIVKGAYDVVAALAAASIGASTVVDGLQAQGYRVLAVAVGPIGALRLAGLVALSDPPRADSAALISSLDKLGVRTVMVTGDAAATARVVAGLVGIVGPVSSVSPLPDDLQADTCAIYAGVVPEDKFRLVKALQAIGHRVGMCGDGANDAPALRQAQMGIAVSTATDVAKSAAGAVLTEPGLGGVVALIEEGRRTFQRILTYTLRAVTHKVVQVLLLAAGLVMTGHAILSPMLMVLMMVTGDFLAMSSSTDHVRPSPQPNVWRIRNLTIAGVVLGAVDLVFCASSLAVGHFALKLDAAHLQTLTVVTLIFSGQAVFYVAREREHVWSSMPGPWLMVSSIVDLSLITVLATNGILMEALPIATIAATALAAVVLAFVLDAVKLQLFRRLSIA